MVVVRLHKGGGGRPGRTRSTKLRHPCGQVVKGPEPKIRTPVSAEAEAEQDWWLRQAEAHIAKGS